MTAVSRRAMLALTAGGALAACSDRSRGLTWWALGTTGENAPLLIPAFTRASGIAVDTQVIPWTGAHEKLLTGFAGNALPDIMMLNSVWLPELALLGAIAPPPPSLLAGQFPGALTAVTIAGRRMAVPWTSDSWVQFYRRDLLAETGHAAPPERWAEWRQMAAAIKRRHPDRYATLHLLDWPEPLFAFAAQQPEPLLRDRNARGNFSTPGFRAALAFYRSIYADGYSPAITGADVGDTYIAFARGWFAILPSNAITIGDLRRRAQMIPQRLWSVAATPGRSGWGRMPAQGTCLAVSSRAANPAHAWRLVAYLGAAATQHRLYEITGDLPTRPAAWTGPGLCDNPVTDIFARQIATSAPPPAVPEWQRILTEVQLVAEHMVRGEYGVEAATREMDRRVDRILEKRRWLLDRGEIA